MPPFNLPFRLGTTSYIIPDDILPNVRFLAGKVQDVQLVLFELDGDQHNLPGPQDIATLRSLARQSDLTYTVHLPLDLRLAGSEGEAHISLEKARRVIEVTRALEPQAYIVHLDGKEERTAADEKAMARWRDQAVQSLRLTADLAGDIRLLAVENLEGYPPDFNDRVITESGCTRCIDIGHLWLDGHDPVDFFHGRFSQTTVMHLHGIGERDHQSLTHVPAEKLDSLFRYLLQNKFKGVLTLEVFSEDDLNSSLQAIHTCLARITE
ncbi:MAG: sugar phosphate isomerase/epimerase [Leptolinea sp.]|jgi:sugar phosphate isomerase/epimerase|nr:sugar phosphate isomerase/epimerase [Leptolinea sp.]